MKLATFAILAALTSASLFGQAPAPAFDKAKLEAYLRHVELWLPAVTVTIDDPKPTSSLAGFNEIAVHLSYNGGNADQTYLISKDGANIIKGDVYNINKSPFQANLDKIKTDLQPSFGAPAATVVLQVYGDSQGPNCKS